MYRLFSRVPRGLDPVAEFFKGHVEDEGNMLVKEARLVTRPSAQPRLVRHCGGCLPAPCPRGRAGDVRS